MAHSPLQHPKSDGIHKTALNRDTHHFEGVTDFDYDAVDRSITGDPEDVDIKEHSLADLGSAVNVLLSWAVKGRSLPMIAGRILSLHWYLREAESEYDSISEIATACNCTRAALSKALLELRDSIGLKISAGKLHSARRTYSKAQDASFKAGKHAAFTGADRKAEATPL
jgi:hypothetical protein